MSFGGKDAGFSERKLNEAKILPALALLSNSKFIKKKKKKFTIFEL